MVRKKYEKRVPSTKVFQPFGKRSKRAPKNKADAPEFKPGKKTSTTLGKEKLNGSINWAKVAQGILAAGYGLEAFAQEMELECADIEKILEGSVKPLTFKLGARMLAIEDQLYPVRVK